LSKLFPVVEVGSLNKAPFRVRDVGRAVAEAERWGSMLGVEGYETLVDKIKTQTLSETEALDWACVYGLKFFEKAGLDIIYDGEQRRVEMYEHPLQYIDGFEFRGVVRVWDNEYYRKAAVVRKPSLKSVYHVDELLFNKKHTSKPLKVPITSAYTLADWSFNEYYMERVEGVDWVEKAGRARYEFVYDLARDIIRPVASELASKGADFVQLDEPAAATKPYEAELVVESINETVKGLNSKIAVHICYTDYAALFPHLLELKADVLSISCSNADTTSLGVEPEKRPGFKVLEVFRDYDVRFALAPGLVDVHTDFVEPAELVRDRLLYACKVMNNPDKLYGCNDCGLRTRRWDVAYRKQLNLVKGCEMARKVFEG